MRWIALPLVLGVLTTVGVAWCIAAWLPQENWHEFSTCISADSTTYCFLSEFRAAGAVRRTWHCEKPGAFSMYSPSMDIPGPSTWLLSELETPFPGLRWGRMEHVFTHPLSLPQGMEHATGWPALAGWYSMRFVYTSGAFNAEFEGAIEFPATPPSRPFGVAQGGAIRALPLRPIWPGLLINTAFYAILWLLPLGGLRAARRAWRRHRGRCPACAYHLVGLTPAPDSRVTCPECGAQE
jgi:hypothetical protein